MEVIFYILMPILVIVAFLLGRFMLIKVGKSRLHEAERMAEEILEEAHREAENIKKAKILEAKDEWYRFKQQFERETRQKRNELHRLERQIAAREANMDRKADLIKKREQDLARLREEILLRERELEKKDRELDRLILEQAQKLEEISGLTQEEAKQRLMDSMIEKARQEAAQIMKDIRDQARVTAHREAKEMIIQAIQKTATSHAVETTVSVVHLPSDEMKGRIIGREGRNIRAFEMATGVEVIVDDTPEIVLLSCFDPIRRETAKIAMEKLISDGRIHPGRIEDVVEKAREEMEEHIVDAGEQAVMDTGVHSLHPELVKALGRLKYRTTYGQNVLQHCVEVAHLAGHMAVELGLDPMLAKRAGLLHDIGKSIAKASDENSAQQGVDLAKRCGEGPVVLNTIASFGGDVPIISPIVVLVQAANHISIYRPGAKRETLEEYVQRLHKLENLAQEFEGVRRAYALQAGREIRIIVDPEKVDDLAADQLAVDVANRIKDELKYPGQIKVTVIREFRVVDYAK